MAPGGGGRLRGGEGRRHGPRGMSTATEDSAMRCPYCLGFDVRPSRRRGVLERLLLLRSWRCRACGARFGRLAWRGQAVCPGEGGTTNEGTGGERGESANGG